MPGRPTSLPLVQDHLASYGFRPMGRKKAVAQLTKIYEETHLVAEPHTPKKKEVSTFLRERLKAEEERRAKKRPPVMKRVPTAAPIAEVVQESTQVSDRTDKSPDDTVAVFLDWLRRPANRELHEELLTLNTVFFVSSARPATDCRTTCWPASRPKCASTRSPRRPC